MTLDIGQRLRRTDSDSDPTPEPGRAKVLVGVIVAGSLALVAAVVLALLDASSDVDHLAIYAAACLILAGLAGAVLCLDKVLADRQAFYRRGHLDGWYRGYRMQPPEVDDPLLR